MGSVRGACEILELKEDLNSVQHCRRIHQPDSELRVDDRDHKPPLLKVRCNDSLEKDLNKLFEAINLKDSPKDLGLSHQEGTGLSRKNALKKMVRVGVSHSPGTEISEPVTLKQALRGLCISQASEMAALKRLSKPASSPRISEAGRIKNLYRAVVVEASESGLSLDQGKGGIGELSLVPEESTSTSFEKMPQYLQVPRIKSSSQSAHSSPRFAVATAQKRTGRTPTQNEMDPASTSSEKMPQYLQVPRVQSPNQSVHSSPRFAVAAAQKGTGTTPTQNEINPASTSSEKMPQYLQVPRIKSPNQSAHSSPRFAVAAAQKGTGTTPTRNEMNPASTSEKMPQYLQVHRIKSPNQSAHSSPRFAVAAAQKGTGTTLTRNEMDPASTSSEKMPQYLQVPRIKSSNQSANSSPLFAVVTAHKVTGTTPAQNEMDLAPTEVGSQTSKTELAQTETHKSLPSLACPSTGENRLQLGKVIPVSIKLANKASAPKPGRKGRLQTVPSSSSSINGNRVSKLTRNTPRLVKPVIRNKNFVKKKLKQDSTSGACASAAYNEVNGDMDPGTSQLVCQRCHCTLKNARKESDQGSPASHCMSLGAEVSSNDVDTGLSKTGFTSDSCSRGSAVVKAKKNSKSREKGEFSQSSKSSLGEYSSSTSISEESNLSRPSCGNRPHMSKDVRWEAIRHVRMQHGTLGLRHFNLLKKLGCGDIGTVYLAELIGTNCLFAIKVMDIEYLARRKKMPRAQTEREILKMLDHPFLPTLFSQFTSDNLSCLLMEYCPGGDLHVLRQKQPGRNFPEQAARFYIAEVLLALEYLHMLGVVYRDLKPENILVREDGHIMLTDFDLSLRCTVSPTLLDSSSSIAEPRRISGPCTGSNCIDPFCIEPSCQVPCFSPRFLPATAKARKQKSNPAAQVRSLPQLVVEPTDARSNSFVGTHEYLAPEIIKGDGHGSAVDWWTFGIFLYELLYGKTPFKGSGNEETLANVVLQSLKFPDSPLVSFQARDLIRGLLVKEPEYRLGSEKGAAEIKQHPFFEGLNWALIRCTIPPELPEFCDYGVIYMASQEKKSKFLDYRATGEHLEFELF